MREVIRSALVAQPPSRIYQIINDVDAYPRFLPWCNSARIESASEREVVATIGIKRGLLKIEFTTCNLLDPDRSVHMRLAKGPFKELDGLWTLTPIGDQGCRVQLELRFEFAVAGVGSVLEPLFEQAAASMVDAFVARAKMLYR